MSAKETGGAGQFQPPADFKISVEDFRHAGITREAWEAHEDALNRLDEILGKSMLYQMTYRIEVESDANPDLYMAIAMPGVASERFQRAMSSGGFSGRWHHHRRELCELSAKFPSMTISLYARCADDLNDVSLKRFRGGECRYQKVEWLPFEEMEELKLTPLPSIEEENDEPTV